MGKEYIEQRDGNYYVSGTRVSLDSLVHAFHRGESAETICQSFEVLQLEEVYGAIAYYLANQAAVDAYLAGQGKRWTEGKGRSGSLPADLSERLTRARDEMHTSRRRAAGFGDFHEASGAGWLGRRGGDAEGV